jgi:cell wall hydrolase
MSDIAIPAYFWTMAQTVCGEARNQDFLTQIGVASVIVNRTKKPGWWGTNLQEVCLKPLQFSCWNHNDPNRDVILKLGLSDKVFRTAYAACMVALNGIILPGKAESDPTGGATHYHDTSIPKPAAFAGLTRTVQLGQIIFYA